MKAEASHFTCFRCGMGFLKEPPVPWWKHLEHLRCECGLVYGVHINRKNTVRCWLIREGGARKIKGVRKIA